MPKVRKRRKPTSDGDRNTHEGNGVDPNNVAIGNTLSGNLTKKIAKIAKAHVQECRYRDGKGCSICSILLCPHHSKQHLNPNGCPYCK